MSIHNTHTHTYCWSYSIQGDNVLPSSHRHSNENANARQGTPSLELLLIRFQDTPKITEAIAIALCCLQEFECKTLLLKHCILGYKALSYLSRTDLGSSSLRTGSYGVRRCCARF